MHWLFLILCLGAYVAAGHAPLSERGPAVIAMRWLMAGWVAYLLAWSAHPPASLFWLIGLPLRSEDLWSLQDAGIGCVMLALGWRHWWGWAVWGALAISQGFHMLYAAGALPYAQYSDALDAMFAIQLACFYILGGPGVVDRIVRYHRRGGHFLRSPSAALSQALNRDG